MQAKYIARSASLPSGLITNLNVQSVAGNALKVESVGDAEQASSPVDDERVVMVTGDDAVAETGIKVNVIGAHLKHGATSSHVCQRIITDSQSLQFSLHL